jgi:hypothetical protein
MAHQARTGLPHEAVIWAQILFSKHKLGCRTRLSYGPNTSQIREDVLIVMVHHAHTGLPHDAAVWAQIPLSKSMTAKLLRQLAWLHIIQ